MGNQPIKKNINFFKYFSCFIKINVSIFAAAFERRFFEKSEGVAKIFIKYFCC